MVSQTEFTLRPRTRGFHLITDEVVRNLPPLPQIGLLYLFIKHTICWKITYCPHKYCPHLKVFFT